VDFFVFISEQWVLVSILVVLVWALAFSERLKGGKPVSAHEVTRLVNSGDGVVVDLRDGKEFSAGHIAGALHIPQSKVNDSEKDLEQYRDRTLVLVDKMGQHAGRVGKKLREAGFEVRRLQGGMAEWSGQGLPLVKKK
jgi:rhodanese-related sulfurtransferase